MPHSSDPVRLINSGGHLGLITDSGEVWVTVTERENDVWSQYSKEFSATEYIILISKDNPLFPHKRQGEAGKRIDVTSAYYFIDLAANTEAVMKLGVITKINGTNADIKYFAGLPFLAGISKAVIIESLRGTPSQVKTDFNSAGVLLHGVTNIQETDAIAVNTGVTLDSPVGNIIPGLGDVVMKYEQVSGSANLAIFLFYHNTN